MKSVFFVVAIAGTITASAQDNKVRKLPGNDKTSIVTTPGKYAPRTILTKKQYSFTLPNGNEVYQLPQDNMPCVAPVLTPGSMPNAGSPSMVPRGSNAIPNPTAASLVQVTSKTRE